MKRMIALIITIAMIASLVGCGGSTTTNTTASTTSAASGTAATTKPAGTTAAAGPKVQFTYCVHNANGPLDEAMDLFAQKLSELSGGRFVGKSYTAGTMGSEGEMVDSVYLGDLTLSTPADTLVLQAFKLDDWESLPGLLTSMDDVKKHLLSKDGYMSQLLDKQFAGSGLVRLGGIDNGFRMVASEGQLVTMADLKGLKARTASVPVMVALYEGVGMIPTIIDSSEVVTALEQGTVDAVENSLANLANAGFIDMLDSVLAVNFLYSARSIICNKDWYDALSAADQELVNQAAKTAADFANTELEKDMQKYMTDSRWKVYELSAEQKAAFQASADKVWDSVSGKYNQEIMSVLLANKK